MSITARSSVVVGCAALAAVGASAGASLITFDTLAAGTTLTTQYPDLVFSSDAGQEVGLYSGSAISSPNFACTRSVGSEINCVRSVFIDFAAPASGLSIWAFEPNEFGIVATFFLYNGATLLGTQDLIGLAASPGTFTGGSKFVDLSSFSNVTRMEIRGPGGSAFTDDSYGGNGIGWDNLSYTIPAPGVAGLLTLAGTAALRRRRA